MRINGLVFILVIVSCSIGGLKTSIKYLPTSDCVKIGVEVEGRTRSVVSSVESLIESFTEESFPLDDGYRGQKDQFGQKDGLGILRLPTGDYYIGQWRRNIRHGLGKGFTAETNDIYLGEYKFDEQHGYGALQTGEGDLYEGEWVVGIQNGQGTYNWADGSKYNGNWVDGSPEGRGTWENEEIKHVGDWVAGKRHGKGTVTRKKDGRILFDGVFKDDKPLK